MKPRVIITLISMILEINISFSGRDRDELADYRRRIGNHNHRPTGSVIFSPPSSELNIKANLILFLILASAVTSEKIIEDKLSHPSLGKPTGNSLRLYYSNSTLSEGIEETNRENMIIRNETPDLYLPLQLAPSPSSSKKAPSKKRDRKKIPKCKRISPASSYTHKEYLNKTIENINSPGCEEVLALWKETPIPEKNPILNRLDEHIRRKQQTAYKDSKPVALWIGEAHSELWCKVVVVHLLEKYAGKEITYYLESPNEWGLRATENLFQLLNNKPIEGSRPSYIMALKAYILGARLHPSGSPFFSIDMERVKNIDEDIELPEKYKVLFSNFNEKILRIFSLNHLTPSKYYHWDANDNESYWGKVLNILKEKGITGDPNACPPYLHHLREDHMFGQIHRHFNGNDFIVHVGAAHLGGLMKRAKNEMPYVEHIPISCVANEATKSIERRLVRIGKRFRPLLSSVCGPKVVSDFDERIKQEIWFSNSSEVFQAGLNSGTRF